MVDKVATDDKDQLKETDGGFLFFLKRERPPLQTAGNHMTHAPSFFEGWRDDD